MQQGLDKAFDRAFLYAGLIAGFLVLLLNLIGIRNVQTVFFAVAYLLLLILFAYDYVLFQTTIEQARTLLDYLLVGLMIVFIVGSGLAPTQSGFLIIIGLAFIFSLLKLAIAHTRAKGAVLRYIEHQTRRMTYGAVVFLLLGILAMAFEGFVPYSLPIAILLLLGFYIHSAIGKHELRKH